MDWEFIVAIFFALPIILLPATFIWFLNVGGLYAAFREAREKRAAARMAESLKKGLVETECHN